MGDAVQQPICVGVPTSIGGVPIVNTQKRGDRKERRRERLVPVCVGEVDGDGRPDCTVAGVEGGRGDGSASGVPMKDLQLESMI